MICPKKCALGGTDGWNEAITTGAHALTAVPATTGTNSAVAGMSSMDGV